MMKSLHRRCPRRGFTLIEAAIVLAVIGTILGGVWIYAQRANEAARLEQAVGQLAIVLKNIRSYYLSYANIANSDVTSTLADADVFPAEMIRAGSSPTLVDHPWGPTRPNGTALAAGGVGISGSNSYFFILTYRGLSTADCIKFATRATAGGTATGLTAISVNGTASTALPATVGYATPLCSTNGTTTGTDVALTYRLRP
jgi:prepilin-type N-terminal cleavage/methylation domain-containing protein